MSIDKETRKLLKVVELGQVINDEELIGAIENENKRHSHYVE